MKRWLALLAIVTTSMGTFVRYWRRNPRVGAYTMNRLVNPKLLRVGVVEEAHGEIGLLEHVGRKSGRVRVTPVHPVPIAGGFRIIVPLGDASQWAQNVLAARHCRLHIGDVVHKLDEPLLVAPPCSGLSASRRGVPAGHTADVTGGETHAASSTASPSTTQRTSRAGYPPTWDEPRKGPSGSARTGGLSR